MLPDAASADNLSVWDETKRRRKSILDTIDKSTKRSNLEIKSDGKRGRIEMDHRGTWQSTTPSLQNTRGGASSDGNKRPAATNQNNFVK